MDCGIYEIRNLDTGHRYIGSAKSFRARWKTHRHHLERGSHHSRHLQGSWKKRGSARFDFRKLIVCDPKNLLFYEQRAIDALKPEYNTATKAGSCLGIKHSPEVRAKNSARMMGNKHTLGYRHSQETIARMSLAKIGKSSALKGKRRATEAVSKTAAAHRGMKRSLETRAKISAARRGQKLSIPRSAEYRAKMSVACKGKKLSPETIAKISATKRAAGYRHTEEWKQQISVASKAMWRDRRVEVMAARGPEWREKIAAALRGRKATPEARANQSKAQIGLKRRSYNLKRRPLLL